MTTDLTKLLNEWAYEPGQVNVRLVQAEDGRMVVQMRVDLGVLQMELEGRPDGRTVEGHESLLEYYESMVAPEGGGPGDDDEEEGDGDGDGDGGLAGEEGEVGSDGLQLDGEACRALREEAAQYYHRFVSLLVLDEYERVVEDTTRNLRVAELCAGYAEDDEDRAALEPFRPYLLMIRARALASLAIDDDEPKAAVVAIDEALDEIGRICESRGKLEDFETLDEVRLLRGMREALTPKLPVSAKEELRRRLDEAVARENYELAAILRDELRQMRE